MSDSAFYDRLEAQVRALLDPQSDFIANAGNFAALIRHELPHVNWAGFYLATAAEDLVLGPFSGKPACTRISKGRGVCGAAAARRETLVVENVDEFADHIACDSASRSEIVVPILREGALFGVFDVDSPMLARFTDSDRTALERLVEIFSELPDAPPAPAR
jgi:GAF domain-containing protein